MRPSISISLGSAALIALSACTDDSSPLSGERNTALRPSSLNPPKTIDYEFLKLAEDIPGFGGMYWDETEKYADETERITVYLTNLESRARDPIEDKILTFVLQRSLPRTRQVAFKNAAFSWPELYEWRESLRGPLFSIPGVTSLGIDELNNRISVGVERVSIEDLVTTKVDQLGIPPSAVSVKLSPYAQTTADKTTDYVRPVAGALKISNPLGACTFSFRSGSYFVTPSHCGTTVGWVDNDKIYQPSASDPNYLIGTEISDPLLFDCGHSTLQCRWSDAALVFIQGDIAQGKIYKTFKDDCCPLNRYVFPDVFHLITEEANWPVLNDWLSIEGFQTGFKQGYVVDTCEDVILSRFGDQLALLKCQDIVEIASQGGDSGAPVFKHLGLFTDDVRIYGILWGKIDASKSVMSAMYNIEYELGFLDPTL